MVEEYEDGVEYEEVSEDDRVVGKAFRISMVIFVALAVLVVLVLWIVKRGGDAPPPSAAGVEAPRTVTEEAKAPAVSFVDVTQAAGIDFVHTNG